MRIGCLQFAPEKGDLNHNLSRADSVLLKANPKNLDLLVLPELAFCGHGFNSLNDIYPFLEPSASGITSLWARTTALKYNCSVVVGYAEKVDVRHKWPSDPEYYNSVIAINSEGETVANYRKCQLQPSDETWALEGPDGFHQDWISELGEVSIGISMDINPYRFQDSWDSFDFALHIMEVAVNIVIVAMAWPSIENSREYSQVPSEPDTDTLMYWISRLEPVIRAENEEEVIIIFCNRCGSQGSTCYTGTSTVLGISNGEVRVYGLLGRGTKELLVVDTSNPPYGRLVYRPSADVAREQEVQAYAFMNRESIASSHVSRLSAKAADARESQPSPVRRKSSKTLPTFSNSNKSKDTAQVNNNDPSISISQDINTPPYPASTSRITRSSRAASSMDSITHKSPKFQQSHPASGYEHIQTPILAPKDDTISLKVLDGDHEIEDTASIAGVSTVTSISASPAIYWNSENASANRPQSRGSEMTAFSDLFESDFMSQAGIDRSIHVTSGSNVQSSRARGQASGQFSVLSARQINGMERLNERFPSLISTQSSSPYHQGGPSFEKVEMSHDPRFILAKDSLQPKHRPTPIEPQSGMLIKSNLARLSQTTSPLNGSPSMRNHMTFEGLVGIHRKKSMSNLISRTQSPKYSAETPTPNPQHRGRRPDRYSNDGAYRSSSGVNTGDKPRSAIRGGSGARKNSRSASRPVDLSEFKRIEEYPSISCPVHGLGINSHGRRSTSQGARHSSDTRMKSRSSSVSTAWNAPAADFQDEAFDGTVFSFDQSERPSSARPLRLGSSKERSTSRLYILPSRPLQALSHTPSLTAPVLERHQTPVAPWVETWMPPISKSVPPTSLSIKTPGPRDTPGLISPPPEDGRATPRAMVVLFDDSHTEDAEAPRILKCVERNASMTDLKTDQPRVR